MFILAASTVLLGRCNIPDEPIVLKNIKEIKLGDLNADEAKLTAVAVLHNPNDLQVRVRHLDITVLVDGERSARIDQTMDLRVPPRSDFTVPLDVVVSMKELGLLDKVLSVLQGKKIAVEYQGSIKIKYRLILITVPIRHKSEIRMKV